MKSHYDLVVALGARVGLKYQGGLDMMVPSKHLEMRLEAIHLLYENRVADRFLLSGGYNVGVRYPETLAEPRYGDNSFVPPKNFSDIARMRARRHRSEASVMTEFLQLMYQMPPECFILEEQSHTTKENALFVQAICKRMGIKHIGLVTNVYHITQATQAFREPCLDVDGIPAEHVLWALDTTDIWRPKICEYYSQPRGEKLWDVEEFPHDRAELFVETISATPAP